MSGNTFALYLSLLLLVWVASKLQEDWELFCCRRRVVQLFPWIVVPEIAFVCNGARRQSQY
eukprot:2633722-Lingulodinium_polyedra.AAC.1